MSESLFVDVLKCPRCDGVHDRLEFLPLSKPIRCSEEHRHYALCPNGEGPHAKWSGAVVEEHHEIRSRRILG